MRRLVAPVAVLTGALVLAGCGSGDTQTDSQADSQAGSKAELSVSDAYMPQPVSDSMAAGFLTVTNKGGTKDELTSVTSDVGDVTAHETVGSSMQEVKDIDVPAHGQLVFKSGGSHLMFEKLKRKPKQGEKVTVQLHFAESGTVTVEIPVKSATYNPKTGH
ncbi:MULTISPECIES: copper chaperone PCu(A)C [unclassified Streptomyces]|uniref:copper chaperone PCu(A)C n=1 Tax=unclassified Streptomyces TaxID=2593676 RepID=UPI002365106C|nr:MULTISPECIES: copper chaperone PCu(A)C [unclassified Streptomyces]MDF3142231.1 copper chaperone PCu(A)C [Streptomyces sp. T21Q-yed]WDF39549.1 copper chaperone PCu(A)C [Streptomyces sp. T12]